MAGSKIPFNPFPTTGEDEYNQPSSRNIAPIINFNRGGLPDVQGGWKKRFNLVRENTYQLGVDASPQLINGLAPDIHNEFAYIDLGTLLGVKSPFIWIPDVYSVVLEDKSASPVPTDLSLSSWNVSLYDNIAKKHYFSASPSNPNSSFSLLGFEIPLPILQFDDFLDIHDYLNFFSNLYIVPTGAIFNNQAFNINLAVRQLLIYRMEPIAL